MALDRASFVGELDDNLPNNRDPRVEGAAQIRAVKTALVNSFPNVKGKVEATHEDMNYAFKHKWSVGMIMMFTGTEAPPGWALCDGTPSNGIVTPDLRDKFIKGWNPVGGENPGASGGSHTATNMADYIDVADHTLTESQMPKHRHYFTEMSEGDYDKLDVKFVENIPSDYGRDGSGNRGAYQTSEEGGGQAHGHNTTSKGSFDKRPAYYALAFIVYVGFPAE